MKIYINNQLVKTQILPSNTPTLDETLETFSFALISNTNPLPYAPMQLVKVDFLGDGTDVSYFYIVSDSVETYSLNPLRYKHNISCVQNTRKLSKTLVRNSTFTQPADPIRKSLVATSGGPKREGTNLTIQFANFAPSANWGCEKVVFADNERTKGNVKLRISFQYIKGYTNGQRTGPDGQKEAALNTHIHNIDEIKTIDPDISYLETAPRIYLKYIKKGSSTTQSREITPFDLGLPANSSFRLNEDYDITDIIRQISGSEGLKEVWLEFQNADFVFGAWKNYDDTQPYQFPTGEYYFFSYFCQLELTFETNYYSIYDILDLLIKRQLKETSRRSLTPLFWLPSSGDLYDLLVSTPAPNFTFTQLTMYECVAEVFRVFDAIFTMDENGELGIEYFNDLSNEPVPDTRFTGRTLSLGEDKYTNGLVAHYQDARVIESFPKQEGVFAHLRSAEFGVPAQQDHNFIVPHAIENIVKCEILANDWTFDITRDIAFDCHVCHGDDLVLDITRYVVEESLWSLLNVGELDQSTINADAINNRKVVKYNSVYFTKGDNKIQIAYSAKSSWNFTVYALANLVLCAMMRKFGLQSPTHSYQSPIGESSDFNGVWYNIKMRLTYIASVNGKLETHSLTTKYNGETLVDQSNGSVDLNKLGLNTLGLSLKLGNPTLNATHRITTWAKRIKTGQIYEYQGKLWVANVVNYTFFNGLLQGKISFVQNFNQLSLRTQLLREKRMTNISKELVQKSEEILTDFVYYFTDSAKATNSNVRGDVIHFDPTHFLNHVKFTFGVNLSDNSYGHIGDAVIFTRQQSGIDYVMTADPYTNEDVYYGIYIPMIIYGAGNTINFEMTFDHPMSAGNKTNATTHWGGHQYYTDHAIYTDKSGFLNEVNIKTPVHEIEYDREFPKARAYSDYDSENRGGFYFEILGFKVYKQPNEIFALNYQLAFLPYPGDEQTDFLGSGFINNNWFTNNSEVANQTRYICFMGEKSSVLDTKVSSYLVKKQITQVTSVTYNAANSFYLNKFGVQLSYDALTSTEKNKGPFASWAIVDNDGNILFASNRNVSVNDTQVSIYFLTSKYRIN